MKNDWTNAQQQQYLASLELTMWNNHTSTGNYGDMEVIQCKDIITPNIPQAGIIEV